MYPYCNMPYAVFQVDVNQTVSAVQIGRATMDSASTRAYLVILVEPMQNVSVPTIVRCAGATQVIRAIRT